MKILFSFGQVYKKGILFLCGVLDDWEENDICHALFFRRQKGNWTYWSINSRIVGVHAFLAPHGLMLIAPCNEGSVYINKEGEEQWETIGMGVDMPSTLRHLTCSRVIGTFLYVAGMQRQVFRKSLLKGGWERADQGALISTKSTEINGFLSIDGVDESNIYGVGFYGHLWNCKNGHWFQITSPTNLKLTSIRCMGEYVYAAGSNGLIIKGVGETWKIIEQDLTSSAFVNIELFNESLFLVNARGVLYRLFNDHLSKVEFDCPTEFHFLSSSEDQLLALGFSMAYLFDGACWTKIEIPEIGQTQ
jgi:hypothetical protein